MGSEGLSRVGDYTLEAPLGAGGSGTVFRARDRSGRAVALKILIRLDPKTRARFDRERRLLASLGEADGFVGLLDAGESPKGPFIVMSFVAGGTLRDRVAQGPIAIEKAIAVARAVAAALGRAHARGIVHRDLKPDNILFTTDGRPLVGDLGLGKFLQPELGSMRTRPLSLSGEMRGTLGYMAPEQARGETEVGPGADVWAIGTILYECLSGSLPFDGESALEVLRRVVEGEPQPIERLRADTPPWLAAVLRRALAKDPAARFRDGGELAAALAAPRPRSPVALLASAGAVLAVAGVLGVAAAARRGGPPDVASSASASRTRPPDAKKIEPTVPGPPVARRAHGRTSKPLMGAEHTRLRAADPVLGGEGPVHASMVETIARSPRGDLIASTTVDGVVGLWDAETGDELAALETRRRAVVGLAFSADGTRLYGIERAEEGREPPSMLVWDTKTHARVATVGGLADARDTLLPIADGRLVLRVARGVAIWDPKTLARQDGALDEFFDSLAAASGVHEIFAARRDGTLVVLDEGTLREKRRGSIGEGVFSFAVSADGRRVLVGGEGGYVRCHDIGAADHFVATTPVWSAFSQDVDPRAPRAKEAIWVRGVAMTPDGRIGVSAAGDSTVGVWDLASGKKLATLEGHTLGWVQGVVVDPRGERAVSCGNDGTVRLWDLVRHVELWERTGHGGHATVIAAIPGQDRAISGGSDGSVLLWDVRRGERVSVLAPPGGDPISAVTVTADGKSAAWAAGHQITVTALAAAATPRRFTLTGIAGSIRAVTLLEGRVVFALVTAVLEGGGRGSVQIFDISGGEVTARPGILPANGASAALAVIGTPDAPRIFTDGPDGLVYELDARTQGVRSRDVGHRGHVTRLQVLAGGRMLSIATDGTAHLWDVDGSGPATVVHLGPAGVLSADATADGACLATIGAERSVVLTDTAADSPLDALELSPVDDFASCVAVGGAHGEWVVVGTARGAIFRFFAR